VSKLLQDLPIGSNFTTFYTGRTGKLLSLGIGSALVRWDAYDQTWFKTFDDSVVSFAKPRKENVSLETEVV